MKATVIHGDCLEALKLMESDSVDSIVSDPPAGIAFMGKSWDTDKGSRQAWVAWMESVAIECLRVLKPGGCALVWALPRTSHWTGWAWENAGWEVREKLVHLYGSGFPKSLSVSKALDGLLTVGRSDSVGLKQANESRPGEGRVRKSTTNDGILGTPKGSKVTRDEPSTPEAAQWDGWGTALKPAGEDWWLFRKPLSEGTVAKNVLKHGTGGINIDGCRIETSENLNGGAYKSKGEDEDSYQCIDPNCPDAATMPYHDHPSEKRKGRHDGAENWRYKHGGAGGFEQPKGRWPANVILSHTPDCQQVGTRTVKSGIAYEPEAGREMKRTVLGATKNLGRTLGYADEHGNETISAWECAPDCAVRLLDEQTGTMRARGNVTAKDNEARYDATSYQFGGRESGFSGDSGGASRFFYTAKASRSERTHGGTVENKHPTVKPISLMRYLVRLVTPPNGTVLDPFTGSGSTGVGAILEGFNFVGCEMEIESVETARERLKTALLVATGGIKNPWEDEPEERTVPEPPALSMPTSIEALFDFDE